MADIITFSDGFVSHKFIKLAPLLMCRVEGIIKEHGGDELYRTSHESGLHERIYEIPEQGTLTFKIFTELNGVNGICLRLNNKNYHCAAHVLLTGFKNYNKYADLKERIENCAKEFNEIAK